MAKISTSDAAPEVKNSTDFMERRQPNQERAQKTKDKILGAVQTILEDTGIDGVTIRSIAKLAGISVGTIYEYFPNKQAILFYIYEKRLKDGLAVFDEVYEGADPNRTLFDLFAEFRRRTREEKLWTRAYLELRNAEERDPILHGYTQDMEDQLTERYVSMEQKRGAVLDENQLILIARFAHQVDHVNMKLQLDATTEDRVFYGRLTTEIFKCLMAFTGCPVDDYKPLPENLLRDQE